MPVQGVVEVDLGGHLVTVPKGGLYDRFRMRTDLDEVERDPRVPSIDFFRRLPKTEVNSAIGPTLTPNFYYRVSTARLVMLARSRDIRARLPRALAPLEVAPGLGLVSVMFFRYDVCDIDFYTEAAVGVAVRPARHGKLGFADLASSLANDHLHSYVLALPVSTQIAQVRGHDGYGFPKWKTELDVAIDADRTLARVANDAGGLGALCCHPAPGEVPDRGAGFDAHVVHVNGRVLAFHAEPDQCAVGGDSAIPSGCGLADRAGTDGGRLAGSQTHQDHPARCRHGRPTRAAYAGSGVGA